VDTPDIGITAPHAIYLIGGRRFEAGEPGFAQAVTDAHAARQRPLCLCVDGGAEMYVARLGNGYIVKRMPETGSRHATNCPSYELPPELSGLGHMLGTAISEDPATGITTLKLDFPLLKMPGRSGPVPVAGSSDSVASNGARLSLRGLLNYLWDQAQLNRWHPGFAGRRNWGTVRRHLMGAAATMATRGETLLNRLYIPEFFTVEERDGIHSRRLAQWRVAMPVPGKLQQLLLLIGEVKQIAPGRHGYKVVIRHLPDTAFHLDALGHLRLHRRFDSELSLWGTADDLRMVTIATFGLSANGAAGILEMSLMLVSKEWLPVCDAEERQFVAQLVSEQRAFIKPWRRMADEVPVMP
jgi:hypothetical protein